MCCRVKRTLLCTAASPYLPSRPLSQQRGSTSSFGAYASAPALRLPLRFVHRVCCLAASPAFRPPHSSNPRLVPCLPPCRARLACVPDTLLHVISLLLILVIMVQLAILRLTVPYLGRSHDSCHECHPNRGILCYWSLFIRIII